MVPLPSILSQISSDDKLERGAVKRLRIRRRRLRSPGLIERESYHPGRESKLSSFRKKCEKTTQLVLGLQHFSYWSKIGRGVRIHMYEITLHYDTFDGFIVLHGTDTLAYTSSALSFMFDSLKKPVVITGAQIPIFERRADAKENFLTSLIIAAYYDIPEVCVFFANKLFRGNRIVKVSSNELDAFSSPNYHTLADIGVDVKVNHHYIRKTDDSIPFKLFDDLNQNVAMLTLFPTITCEMLNSFLECSLKGIVIQSYGSGNIPSKRNDLLSVFKKAVEKEMLIVNITQCSRGSVHASYEPGKVFKDIGIICGRDMTAEAALTKLAYVLALPGLSFQQRVQMMKTDLRGEMSVNVEDF
nr:L-asparaginase-like [Leptinotarsa decemlineata]